MAMDHRARQAGTAAASCARSRPADRINTRMITSSDSWMVPTLQLVHTRLALAANTKGGVSGLHHTLVCVRTCCLSRS